MTARARTPALATASLVAIASAACGGRGCARESAATAPAPSASAILAPASVARPARSLPVIVVPRAGAPIVPDGKNDEPPWMGSGRSGPFLDAAGAIGRPYADARVLWDDDRLYLTLYAADRDIRAPRAEHDGALEEGDAFTVRLAPAASGDGGAPAAVVLVVAPNGAVADAREASGARDLAWESHAVVGADADGTANRPDDEDEEWIVEIALPWAAIGVAPKPGLRLAARFERCDPKGAERRCSRWGDAPSGEIVLGPSVSEPPTAPAGPPRAR